jgi:hypothetical protein
MWVRFGGDDQVKPQEYSEYFEDFTTEERSKMARRRDARTEVILSLALTQRPWKDRFVALSPAPRLDLEEHTADEGVPDEAGRCLLQRGYRKAQSFECPWTHEPLPPLAFEHGASGSCQASGIVHFGGP